MRTYLAMQSGVKPEREFMLLQLLGDHLPGAVVVRSQGQMESLTKQAVQDDAIYHFSPAGVQIKFSAVLESKAV